MGDNISPAGFYLFFTSINDKICELRYARHRIRNTCRIDRQSIAITPKSHSEITEINWIFDLSWHKFDVNEIGHFTCGFFTCRHRQATTTIHDIGLDVHKNCHSAAQSGRSSTRALDIRDDIAIGSESSEKKKWIIQFHYIKNSEFEQSSSSPPLHVMSLVACNIAHLFFNWMRQDNRTRSRAQTISRSHTSTWRLRLNVCAHAFTHAWPWNRKLYFVSQLNQV